MKRIGPWIVCGALALVTLGIVSAPRFNKSAPEREIHADIAGVTTVDIGSLDIDNITLQSRGSAVMRYGINGFGGNTPDVQAKRIDQTLVYSVGAKPLYIGKSDLTLPADVSHLKGRRVTIEAVADIDVLRIDAGMVSWKGNAQQLDVHLQSRRRNCSDHDAPYTSFDFQNGKVARLLIVASGTSVVKFGDISQVDDIELHSGPNTRVEARLADFARIRVLPIDELSAQSAPLASGDTDCGKTDAATELAPSP